MESKLPYKSLNEKIDQDYSFYVSASFLQDEGKESGSLTLNICNTVATVNELSQETDLRVEGKFYFGMCLVDNSDVADAIAGFVAQSIHSNFIKSKKRRPKRRRKL